MTTNKRPTYYAVQYRSHISGKPVEGRYSVFENKNGQSEYLFNLSIYGIDLVNELCKRGIPREDAKMLAYEMTG